VRRRLVIVYLSSLLRVKRTMALPSTRCEDRGIGTYVGSAVRRVLPEYEARARIVAAGMSPEWLMEPGFEMFVA
jgi:hypothetical protein